MLCLRKHLDLSNTFDAAIWAVASIAWCACCRLGELIIDSPTVFDPLHHVSRSTQVIRSVASNKHKSISFKIPFSKTKLNQGEWIQLTEFPGLLDPTSAFEHHLVVNSDVPITAPLFSFTTPSGWSPLLRKWLLARCNNLWRSNGLPTIQGHGFRIGGTTHLLTSGVDPWVVMKQGRWSSKSFLAYWRNIEEILPLFIGDSLDKNQSIHDSIQKIAHA
jgi:hypothetical protein